MFEARFQTFEDRSDPGAVPRHVAALRQVLRQQGLDGFVLPRADRFQNEYVPPSEERLAWLTGFTGSSGFAAVLADKAALFVDGRYTLQAADQTDKAVFAIRHLVEEPPEDFIAANLREGGRLGYDPWLHTAAGAEKLARACARAGGTLVPVPANPIDPLWTGRPGAPAGKVVLHDSRYAGETAAAKLDRIRAAIVREQADALIVTDPHALAWSFNIRGSDVAHTPIPLAFAIVPKAGRPSLFIDGRKLDNAVRDALEALADIRPPEDFEIALARRGGAGETLLADQATAADALSRLVGDAGGKMVRGQDPIAAMKAAKNAAEIAGAREAHIRDGAAFVRFLAWFDREAPGGQLTEIGAVAALESFRRETGLLRDISFPTISGSGPNGAIVHYRVTRKTDRKIGAGELFLIDSGAQYQDGTTDITRTLPVGKPSDEMRERFTLVLKGHIAIARAIFPDGASGAQLDTLARKALWEHGLDFDHGTGHGVGSYLSVHEGPGRISKLGTAPLRQGMILSNEPGYYKAGAYGIRIENLVLVVAAPPIPGGEKAMNAFETLTLAPIDLRLVMPDLLDRGEQAWLDRYHARVRATLAPLLDPANAAWLDAATRPLG